MTIQSQVWRHDYTSAGGTEYPYTFRILDESHLVVYAAGVLQTLNSQYTVDGVGDAVGGNVTFTTAPAVGAAVVIQRNVPLTQLTDYTENDIGLADTREDVADKACMIDQQQQEQLDRCVQAPTNEATVSMVLPAKTTRASKVLGFTAAGVPTAVPLPTAGGGDMSLATVLATGSTTLRTMAERFGEVVNVQDYGAVGDGITDDTAAIQAALDVLPKTGGVLVIPRPSLSYLITDTVVAELLRGCRITGPGGSQDAVWGYHTFTWGGAAGGTMFQLLDCSSTRVEHLSISGNAGGNIAGIGLQIGSNNIPNVNSNQLVNLYVADCSIAGVNLKGMTTGIESIANIKIEDCIFFNNRVNLLQEAANAQNTCIVNTSFGCTTLSPAASCETDYNIKLGGGSIYGYDLNFTGAAYADTYCYLGGASWGTFPGLWIYGAYSESLGMFFDYDPATGGLDLHAGLHFENVFTTYNAHHAGVGYDLRLGGINGTTTTIIGGHYSLGISVEDTNQVVVIIAPRFTSPATVVVTGTTPAVTWIGSGMSIGTGTPLVVGTLSVKSGMKMELIEFSLANGAHLDYSVPLGFNAAQLTVAGTLTGVGSKSGQYIMGPDAPVEVTAITGFTVSVTTLSEVITLTNASMGDTFAGYGLLVYR